VWIHAGRRKWLAYGGNDAPVLAEESDVTIETGSQAPKRVLLGCWGCLGGRQDILDQLRGNSARLIHRAAREMPHRGRRETEQHEAGEQRKIEAQVEAQH
jgi:hypothetical protein